MSNMKRDSKAKKQGKMTLKEYLDEWLSDIEGSIKPNTYTAYYGHIHNHIHRSSISNMRLKDLQPGDIQSFVKNISGVRGGRLSGKTVRLVYDMLKSALNNALDNKYIDSNPCFRVRLPRHTPKETHILSVKEQERLEKTISSAKGNMAFGVLLCLYTGLRLGELCALQYSDIDFENRELTVQRTLSRITVNHAGDKRKTIIAEDAPKTKKSNRVIPLPEFLAKELKARQKHGDSHYVVSMQNGRRVQPRTMQDAFKRLMKKSGLKQTNFHTLRHTFATRAIELNVNVCAVSEILGHSNISITISRYIHALKDQKLAAAKHFDKFYKEKNR